MEKGLIDFTQATLSSRLKGHPLVTKIHYFNEIGSTNAIACGLAQDGAEEGAVVLADAQMQGRGRLGRVWQSPPGLNLYTSMILRPKIAPARAPQITLTAGVAVAELLSHYCPEGVTIKWPNDVLVRGKKVCGILTEMKTSAGGLDFVILGIGVNINMNREDFEPSLRDTATSIRIETASVQDRLDVISRLYDLVEIWYKIFLRDGFIGLRGTWLARADILGRRVKVVFRDDVQTGMVTGIDDDGTLLMRRHDGLVQRVIAGDVHLLKETSCF